ncbi:MAG: class I SAM-dependent methyltransferase [Candidatus Schekmanbacteria bacterium]|nr:class I SAM-dependent methyltransferase [Candidatus Schekmanbacteria bacterium]
MVEPTRVDNQCYLCHSSEMELLSDKGRYNIHLLNKVCKGCGLAQISPRPRYEEVLSYYKNGTFIDENQDRNYEKRFDDSIQQCMNVAKNLKADLIKYAPDIISSKSFRVLEIGSYCGAFLSAWKETFPNLAISGVEPDSDIAAFSKTKVKVPIYVSTLEEFEHKAVESYDLIVSFAVLEHIFNPLEFMCMVNKLLKPNGLIFFWVPNMHSHSTWLPFWYDWYLKEHLFHFSAPTITRLFAQAGFLPLTIDEEKKLAVLAIKSDKIPPEALNAKDDYRRVLQSHHRFKREHFFYQFTNIGRFAMFLLFLLFGHKLGFKIYKTLINFWQRRNTET